MVRRAGQEKRLEGKVGRVGHERKSGEEVGDVAGEEVRSEVRNGGQEDIQQRKSSEDANRGGES